MKMVRLDYKLYLNITYVRFLGGSFRLVFQVHSFPGWVRGHEERIPSADRHQEPDPVVVKARSYSLQQRWVV